MPTEAEIIKLEEEVGEADTKDPAVKAFLTASLKTNEDEEKKLQVIFRINKLLRNDDQMKQDVEKLRKVRDLIAVIRQLLSEGQGARP